MKVPHYKYFDCYLVANNFIKNSYRGIHVLFDLFHECALAYEVIISSYPISTNGIIVLVYTLQLKH